MEGILIFAVFFAVIISLGIAFACSIIAKKKNRSGIGWFFAGLFTGAIGLIAILCLKENY